MPLGSDPNRSPQASQIQAEAKFQAFLDAKKNCKHSDVPNLTKKQTGKASLLEGGRSVFKSDFLDDGEEIDAILQDLHEESACGHHYDRAHQMGKLKDRQVEDQNRFLQERLKHESPAPGESFFDNPAVIPPSSAAKECTAKLVALDEKVVAQLAATRAAEASDVAGATAQVPSPLSFCWARSGKLHHIQPS